MKIKDINWFIKNEFLIKDKSAENIALKYLDKAKSNFFTAKLLFEANDNQMREAADRLQASRNSSRPPRC